MSGRKQVTQMAQILERFNRSMNMKISVDKSASVLSCSFPGFKYDDFDRSGFLNMAKANRMMEATRTIDWKLMSPDAQFQKTRFFLLSSLLKASKQLYRTASVDCPMKFNMHLSNVGKTSVDSAQSLTDEQTGSVLFQRIVRVVNTDRVTRSATPLPNDYVSLLKTKVRPSDDAKLPRYDIPAEIPEKHFLHNECVRFSDMDFVFHCNQGSYLMYSLECAARAASEGFYSQISDDICFYPVKSAFGLHVAECFAGDALQVFTWEDEKDPMLIYFAVKNKGKIAYYARVEFYRPEELAN